MQPFASREDIAWTAGIIDGEGSICINKPPTHWRTKVIVGNTNKSMVNRLLNIWGGSVSFVPSRNPNAKDSWRWEVQQKATIPLLESVLPYLWSKSEQAVIALILQNRVSSHMGLHHQRIDSDEEEIRCRLYEELKILNRRGR